MVVNWTVPVSNNQPITQYYIRFSFVNRNQSSIERVLSIPGQGEQAGVTLAASLTDLVPNQNYSISIRAQNAIGFGDFSPPLSVTTAEDGRLWLANIWILFWFDISSLKGAVLLW